MSVFDSFKGKGVYDQRYDVLLHFPKGWNIEVFHSDDGETVIRWNNITKDQETAILPDSLECHKMAVKKHYIVEGKKK